MEEVFYIKFEFQIKYFDYENKNGDINFQKEFTFNLKDILII